MFFNRSAKPPPHKNAAAKSTNAVTLGAQAEARAEQFLQQQGLTTRLKNYRCKPGEIDLIMMDDKELIFVEVRLRSHSQFANACESVTFSKQAKIIKAAQCYLQEQHLTETAHCRFDVVAFSDSDSEPEWIKNAFSTF